MILFSIISIIFYYILCKNLVFVIDDAKFPFKRIHFILLFIGACIPYINICVFALVSIGLSLIWRDGGIDIKNPNNKVFKFLNKEL